MAKFQITSDEISFTAGSNMSQSSTVVHNRYLTNTSMSMGNTIIWLPVVS